MSFRFGRLPIVLAVIAAVGLTGCASIFHKKKKTDLSYQERPVDLLYATGADALDRGSWGMAVLYFKEVERQHPYSEWARRAILMQAYAHYQANQYAEAVGDADRFVSLYPGNASAVYAYYIKSVCYFEQILDVGRDQASTQQALAALNEVIKRYPTTEYAADARVKLDMVNDQLAGKELAIGRWYEKNNQPFAAMGRFKTVVDTYQTTAQTPEALYRLVEVDLQLGLLGEAQKNAAVLGKNFPGDPWYIDAYKLMTAKGFKPAVEPKAKKSLLEKWRIG